MNDSPTTTLGDPGAWLAISDGKVNGLGCDLAAGTQLALGALSFTYYGGPTVTRARRQGGSF